MKFLLLILFCTMAHASYINAPSSGSGGITTLNTLTGATQTFATPGTTGTAPTWSSTGTAHTLNLPNASASGVTRGLISKTQYDTFNNKIDLNAIGMKEEISGLVDVVEDRDYVLVEYAMYAKRIDQVSAHCDSGGVNFELMIDGADVTSCEAYSLGNSIAPPPQVCSAPQNMAIGSYLVLRTTATSACIKMSFTIQTTRI